MHLYKRMCFSPKYLSLIKAAFKRRSVHFSHRSLSLIKSIVRKLLASTP